MKHTTNTSLLIAALGFLSTALQADTIYNLATANIEAPGQNTYVATTAQGGQGGGLSWGSGKLVFTHGGTSGTSGDYFFGKFTPQILSNVGDVLTLNFTATVTYPGTAPTGDQLFRFGFFNTGALTTEAFTNQTGYRVDFGTTGGANSGFRERTGSTSNLFASAPTSPRLSDQTNSDYSFVITSGTAFSGSLSLELLENGSVKLTTQVGNLTSVTATDATNAFTTFDTFSFYYVRGLGTGANTVTFDSLSVAFTPVPEPSTVAALCGLAALLATIAIRHR
ncbi:PEP-CTERM sorting domain-containing protein [Geminisphaera colitermitum]|uniref:PEP-CTERM sorting domain-containing protein n=1 Tax=Geminisphaera colitermitum TaxID=1148786 RepID=UPI000158CCD3|nr:PEP-CTERM sorting domain-containing protein [Geminisphaera colitermitum]